MLLSRHRSDGINGKRVDERSMRMGVAEAAHQSAAPTVNDKSALQRLRCEFFADADDTLSFDEYIPSVRCCAGGIQDIDVHERNDRIITARLDFHTGNFQAGVHLGLFE